MTEPEWFTVANGDVDDTVALLNRYWTGDVIVVAQKVRREQADHIVRCLNLVSRVFDGAMGFPDVEQVVDVALADKLRSILSGSPNGSPVPKET